MARVRTSENQRTCSLYTLHESIDDSVNFISRQRSRFCIKLRLLLAFWIIAMIVKIKNQCKCIQVTCTLILRSQNECHIEELTKSNIVHDNNHVL